MPTEPQKPTITNAIAATKTFVTTKLHDCYERPEPSPWLKSW